MGKVDVRLERRRHFFMLRKFLPVVECDGVTLIHVGRQQARHDPRDALGMLTAYVARQHIARLAFSQCYQAAFVILANDGVALPVANTGFLFNDLRPLIDADTVLERASSLLPAGITLAVRLLMELLAIPLGW